MKKYLWDAGFIILAAGLAFLLAGTPPAHKPSAPRPAATAAAVEKPEVRPQTAPPEAAKPKAWREIGKRNVFAASGDYSDRVQKAVPENSYTLVGAVYVSEKMQAIFRDHTGSIIKAGEGQRMADGFRISSVQSQRVVLKRGGESKILGIYGASASAPRAGATKIQTEQKPRLVAVLKGLENKAVFRGEDGHLTVFQNKQSLPDGSVITDIESRSVKLKDGRDRKELILSVETPVVPKRALGAGKTPERGKPARPQTPARRMTPVPATAGAKSTQGAGL